MSKSALDEVLFLKDLKDCKDIIVMHSVAYSFTKSIYQVLSYIEAWCFHADTYINHHGELLIT